MALRDSFNFDYDTIIKPRVSEGGYGIAGKRPPVAGSVEPPAPVLKPERVPFRKELDTGEGEPFEPFRKPYAQTPEGVEEPEPAPLLATKSTLNGADPLAQAVTDLDLGKNIPRALEKSGEYVSSLFKPNENIGGLAPLSLIKSGLALFKTGDVSAGEKALSESEANLSQPAKTAMAQKREQALLGLTDAQIRQIGSSIGLTEEQIRGFIVDRKAKEAALPYAGPAAAAGVSLTQQQAGLAGAQKGLTQAQAANTRGQFAQDIKLENLKELQAYRRAELAAKSAKDVATIGATMDLAKVNELLTRPVKDPSGRSTSVNKLFAYTDLTAATQPEYDRAFDTAQLVLSQDKGLDAQLTEMAKAAVPQIMQTETNEDGTPLTPKQAFKRAYVSRLKLLSPLASKARQAADEAGQLNLPPGARPTDY